MARLRLRVSAHGELKASWLLRWCDDDDLHRLLDPTVCWAVRCGCTSPTPACSCSAVSPTCCWATGEISGLDLPGEDATVREVALELYRHGDTVFGPQRWQAFLIAAGKALRATSRWVPASAVSDFEGELAELVVGAGAQLRSGRPCSGCAPARDGRERCDGRWRATPAGRLCSSRCCRR